MTKFRLTTIFCVLHFMCIGQINWQIMKQVPDYSAGIVNVKYLPKKYAVLELEYKNLVSSLKNAPLERSRLRSNVLVSLPIPSGELINFYTTESPAMGPKISEKFPSIKSFKVISEDKKFKGRFDISPYGLRAVIDGPDGEIYIDPFYKDNTQYYISYYTKDHNEPLDLVPPCGSNHINEVSRDIEKPKNRSEKVQLHEYKLALACTGEWGKVRGTTEKALADMNTSVNRLNQIFEKEFASTFVLIDNNDKLIHLNPELDPYSNANSGGSLLGQNTEVVNSLVGANNYDLGHIYTNSCTDVGGVAQLGSICQGNKGSGVTCFYTDLLVITVQVAAHEMGHQFSASHTFNFCSDASQNAGENGFEPGGGSTIMAYGGLCGANDIVGANDGYYHNGSLAQIYSHLRSSDGGAFGCATKVETDNIAPVAKTLIKSGTYIPISTPFFLDGQGTDEDGDALLYNWEGKDASVNTCVPGVPEGNCPLFKSVKPNSESYRFFPRESRILLGNNAPDEVLPSYSRDLKFSFTVRDNDEEAGIADWTNITLKATDKAGPFEITSPNLGEQLEAGKVTTITWNVANTDKAPVNCKYVDIYLSTKSALHPSNPNLRLLAERVPNNGSAEIQLDETVANDARIMIKASDNVFFDVSSLKSVIKPATKPTAFIKPSKTFDKACLPYNTSVEISARPIGGFNENIEYKLLSLPAGINAKFDKDIAGVDFVNKLNIELTNELTSGIYNIQYNVKIGDVELLKQIDFEVTSTDFSNINTLLPLNGEKNAELPTFKWTPSLNATNYILEVSKDPSFINLEFSQNITDTSYRHFKTFDKKSIFYWRLKGFNDCKQGDWLEIKSFGTLTQDCKEYSANGLPLNISGSGLSKIESKINVPTGVNISDVNVKKLKISHTNFKDLTGTLISPKGTRTILWDKICEISVNLEVLIDDQAPNPFKCENTATGQYRPKEKLEKFNTEDATGPWTLEVKDNVSGNGGKLDAFEIEICASVNVEDPYIIKSEPLFTSIGEIPNITNNYLLVEDKNNVAKDLTFVVVKNTSFGNLLLNGQTLAVGSTFTQEDINSNKLSYSYTGNIQSTNVNDGFNFVVKDTEGGWFGVNKFNIIVNAVVSVDEESITKGIELYPNPAYNFIEIKLHENAKDFSKVRMLDLIGREVLSFFIFDKNVILDVSKYSNGLYLLEFNNGKEKLLRKIILSK